MHKDTDEPKRKDHIKDGKATKITSNTIHFKQSLPMTYRERPPLRRHRIEIVRILSNIVYQHSSAVTSMLPMFCIQSYNRQRQINVLRGYKRVVDLIGTESKL